MSFPRYPKYKTSGVEWQGDMPEGWAIVPLKIAASVAVSGIDKKSKDDEKRIRFLGTDTVYSSERITAEIELEECSASDEQIRSFSLLAEDVVVTKDSVVPTKIAVVSYVDQPPEQAVCGYHLALVRSHPQRAVGLFLFYSLKSTALASYFLSEARGTTIIGIGGGIIGKAAVPLPSLPEQTAIAEFLDRETGKIDELVAEQRRLMELLKEKRQAVISHAVTQGLNPQAPMKPSGIEWLNEIPEHWRVVAFKNLAKAGTKTFTDGDWIETPYITSEGVRLLQTGNIGIGHFKEQGFRYVSERTFNELGCTEVKPKDVLICRLDGPVGRGCLAPDLGVRMITSVDNAILKVAADVVPEFVVSLLSSVPWISWMDALCRVGGGFRLRISRSQLGEIRVPLPPFKEQLEIRDRLGAMGNEFDTLTAEAQRAIDLLQERRTALISAAVTGQIDVRQPPKN